MLIAKILKDLGGDRYSPQEKGRIFENIVRCFFKYDKLQQAQYAQVFTFAQYIGQCRLQQNDFLLNRQDTGVDLILELADGRGVCAVQCKWRIDGTKISKNEVDSFYANVRSLVKHQVPIVETIFFISHSGHISSHVKKYLRGRDRLMLRDNLINSNITVWPKIAQLWTGDINYAPDIQYRQPKTLRNYQKTAVQKVIAGWEKSDRGQMIMACGTGKTFTALKIAETLIKSANHKKWLILFLMPSLSLVNQTLKEWYQNKTVSLKALVVCSDRTIGRDYDTFSDEPEYLLITPTTDPKLIGDKIVHQKQNLVVFATYQSLNRIAAVLKEHRQITFDLIICDEAHNTAGAKAKASNWVMVHDQTQIRASKRLYMTATPKVYVAKHQKNNPNAYDLYDMNAETGKFGPLFYEYNFRDAVIAGDLSNYKLIVGYTLKNAPSDPDTAELTAMVEQSKNNQQIDTAHFKAEMTIFEKAIIDPDFFQTMNNPTTDFQPRKLKRIIAFHPRIDQSKLFQKWYETKREKQIYVDHIDARTNANDRSEKIDQLKVSFASDQETRVLSNARFLSEGIDLPALDAICFFNKKSGTLNRTKISLIQAVGRVMRKGAKQRYWLCDSASSPVKNY